MTATNVILIAVIFCLCNFKSMKGNIRYVQNCPNNSDSFEAKRIHFKCSKRGGMTYHCLLSKNGSLVETCLRVRGFHSNLGCPVINIHLNKSTSISLLRCPLQCGNRSYRRIIYTDSLYKYPECLSVDILRVTPTQQPDTSLKTTDKGSYNSKQQETKYGGNWENNENYYKHDVTTQNTQYIIGVSLKHFDGPSRDLSDQSVSRVYVYLAVGGGIIFVIVSMACTIFAQCRRIRALSGRVTYMTSVPYSSKESHAYDLEEGVYHEVIIDGNDDNQSYVEPNPPTREQILRQQHFKSTSINTSNIVCDIQRCLSDIYLDVVDNVSKESLSYIDITETCLDGIDDSFCSFNDTKKGLQRSKDSTTSNVCDDEDKCMADEEYSSTSYIEPISAWKDNLHISCDFDDKETEKLCNELVISDDKHAGEAEENDNREDYQDVLPFSNECS